MDLELAGKRALVTGSSRGIGRAIAHALAAEGCRVALCSRGGPDLTAAVASIRTLSNSEDAAHGIAGDLTTAAGVIDIVDGSTHALGGLDIVVNNVGGSGARSFDQSDDADLAAIVNRNLTTAFRVSKAAVPRLREAGGGAIVMIASVWGRESGGGISYNVAKAGEIALAKAMSRDLAADRIRVNTVAPGSILFPGGGWERRQQQDPAGIAAFIDRELPWKRFGHPDEVANVVVFLCSAKASWITGACVPVDGGQGRAL